MPHVTSTRKRPLLQDPDRIIETRRLRGLTQAQLARKVRLSPQHMSSIESGFRGASEPTLQRLALALDCEVSELMPRPEKAPQRGRRRDGSE